MTSVSLDGLDAWLRKHGVKIERKGDITFVDITPEFRKAVGAAHKRPRKGQKTIVEGGANE